MSEHLIAHACLLTEQFPSENIVLIIAYSAHLLSSHAQTLHNISVNVVLLNHSRLAYVYVLLIDKYLQKKKLDYGLAAGFLTNNKNLKNVILRFINIFFLYVTMYVHIVRRREYWSRYF